MTNDTRPEATPYPYQVADAAEAVRLFFAERVRVSDPKMSGDTSKPRMHERICDLAASTVLDRLYIFWNDKPYGENEEIEFTFGEGSAAHGLTSPVPLVKDLDYRFHGVGIYLKCWIHDLAAVANGTYVLRVSANLVTFAGKIVWSNQAQ
jgi:hypothetical protein